MTALWLPLAAYSQGSPAPADPPAPAGAPTGPRERNRLADQVLTQGPLRLIVRPAAQELEVRFREQPVLLYSMAVTNYKPYVKELRTPGGRNLLLDAPPDHLHHHGLMYAITVNGTNFWEEQTDPSVQRADIPARFVNRMPDGRWKALFRHRTAWLAGQHRQTTNLAALALLFENRTLSLVVDTNANEILLHWRSDFTVGRGAETVRLSGTAYHGLGMRLAPDFNLKARHLNSENAPYSAEQKWDVTPARWAAVLGHQGTDPVMAAVFASPKNAGESRFFSMLNPFAYLSATQGLDEKPLTYQRGEAFRLDYLVLGRDGHLSPAELEARYRKWLQEMDTLAKP